MKILKDILRELKDIKKELQAIRNSENLPLEIKLGGTQISKVVRQAMHDNDEVKKYSGANT